MLKVFVQPGLSTGSTLDGIIRKAKRLARKIRRNAGRARTRRTLATLSPEQIEDAGIDPAALGPAKPRIEVSRQLMARLMTLR